MKTTSTTSQNPQVQAVTGRKQQKADTASAETTDFGKVIQTLLGRKSGSQEVSEEDLFAAACFKIIKQQYGVEMARDFKAAFKLAQVDKPAKEMYPSSERAAKEALDFFVKSTILSKEQADGVRQIAGAVCQLDDKPAIWDSWGDTKAVTTFANAQVQVGERLQEALGDQPSVESKSKSPVNTLSSAAYKPEAAVQPAGSKSARTKSGATKQRRFKSVG